LGKLVKTVAISNSVTRSYVHMVLYHLGASVEWITINNAVFILWYERHI